MSDPQTIQPLTGQRVDGESDPAVSACNDYLRMGPGRSLRGLFEATQKADKSLTSKPSWGTIAGWSKRHAWQERAVAYDAEQDKAKTDEIRRIRTEGLAADHNRILELDDLFQALKREFEANGVWHTDTKLAATGATVEVEVFNKPLIDSMRGVLDDLAKETGGRKQQIAQTTVDLSNATDDQVDRIADGEDPIKVMARRG